MKFEEAYRRLQEIAQRVKSDSLIDIDEIISLQKEAKELHDFCASKLSTVENDLTKNSK